MSLQMWVLKRKKKAEKEKKEERDGRGKSRTKSDYLCIVLCTENGKH